MADAVDMDKAPTEAHVLLSAHMKRAVSESVSKLTGAGMFKERLVVLRPKTITCTRRRARTTAIRRARSLEHTLEEYDTGSDDTYAFMIETEERRTTTRSGELLQCATKEEREKWKSRSAGRSRCHRAGELTAAEPVASPMCRVSRVDAPLSSELSVKCGAVA